jgi:type I restriction enzyme M protein
VDYFDFAPELKERSQIRTIVESNPGVQAKEGELKDKFNNWWQDHEQELIALPDNYKALMPLRRELLSSFVSTLHPIGLLERYKLAGAIASWWEEVKYDLKTLNNLGFDDLVDSWINTIRDALKDEEGNQQKPKDRFDLNHKLILRLLPEYLQEIADAEAAITDLEGQKEAFERGGDAEVEDEDSESDEGEADAVNFARELEQKLKELKNSIKDSRKQIKLLSQGKGSKRKKKSDDMVSTKAFQPSLPLQLAEIHTEPTSIAVLQKSGQDMTDAEAELAKLQGFVASVEAEIAMIEQQLKPYNEIKEKLTEARRRLRALKADLDQRLDDARSVLTDEACQRLVLDIFKDGLTTQLDRYITAHRQQVIVAVENWWDKYRVTLQDIEWELDAARQQWSEFLSGLGYA